VLFSLSKQKQIVEQVGSSVTFDHGLDVFDLAAQMQNVQPGNITFQTVPGLTPERIDGAEVLQLPGDEEVEAFFASLGAEPAEAPTPSGSPAGGDVEPADVTVSVLNGSGVSGAAAAAATTLADAGFAASSGGNATPTDTTAVRHAGGDEDAAALVAAEVPGAAVTVDESLPAGTVSLVLGTDYNGIGAAVDTPQPAPGSGGPASDERTATDTSCIN
jgi:hypothetical protein